MRGALLLSLLLHLALLACWRAAWEPPSPTVLQVSLLPVAAPESPAAAIPAPASPPHRPQARPAGAAVPQVGRRLPHQLLERGVAAPAPSATPLPPSAAPPPAAAVTTSPAAAGEGGAAATTQIPAVATGAGTARAVRALSTPRPAYPALSRELGEEGSVLLRLQIDADGAVAAVQLLHSSGHPRLDRAAREAARGWHFAPQLERGVAVASVIELPVRFALQDE